MTKREKLLKQNITLDEAIASAELAMPMDNLEKIIEGVLLTRIKRIGDDEQIYTGTPTKLIKELNDKISSEIAKAKQEARDEAIEECMNIIKNARGTICCHCRRLFNECCTDCINIEFQHLKSK